MHKTWSIWVSWYRKFAKMLHAIFHCYSKITSVWNWTVACVLGNLYEINFYSCLYKQNLLLSTTWLGFRKFPKWFIVICAYSMKLIYYWTYAVILARENRSSEPFIQKDRRIHIMEDKKSWVFGFKWSNYLQEQNICYQSYSSFLFANIVKTLDSRIHLLTKYFR